MTNEEKLKKMASFYEDSENALNELMTAWAKGNKALCERPFGEVRDRFVLAEEELFKKRTANHIARKSTLLRFALEPLAHAPTRSQCLHR